MITKRFLASAILLAGSTMALGQSDAGKASIANDSAAVSKPTEPALSNESFGWSRVDFLWWRVKDAPLPIPLATAGGSNFDPFDPHFGQPGSQVLLGGRDVGFGQQVGVRISGGMWMNSERTLAWDVSGFLLEKAAYFDFVGNDAVILGTFTRPYIDANTGHLAAASIQVPGQIIGSLTVTDSTRFWGADSNVRLGVMTDEHWRLDLLAGVRYLGLNEKLLLRQNLGFTALPNTVGQAYTHFVDRFYTNNQYLGGQIGAEGEYHWGKFFVGAIGKVAAGSTHETVEISEQGLFALNSNVGVYSRDQFACVSEGEVRVGCQMLDCLRVHVGYSCLYWSKVVRPGDQIDQVVNTNFIKFPLSGVGPSRPGFAFNDTDFWAHGASIGVELRY